MIIRYRKRKIFNWSTFFLEELNCFIAEHEEIRNLLYSMDVPMWSTIYGHSLEAQMHEDEFEMMRVNAEALGYTFLKEE